MPRPSTRPFCKSTGNCRARRAVRAAGGTTALAVMLALSPARAEGLLEAFIMAVPADAAAQATPDSGITGRIYEANVLLPEELKACLALARTIDEESVSLDQRRQAVLDLDARIDSVSAELQSQADRKFYSPDEVKAFNNRVADYNTIIEQRAVDGDAYNAAVDAFDGLTKRFAATCNERSFFAEDLRALAEELPEDLRARLP